MESSLILLRFYVFSYIIDDHSRLNFCMSTKLSQIVCLINVHILVCKHATCDCSLWKVLWFNAFFGNYHILLHVWNAITSSNFYKFCIKAEAYSWKVVFLVFLCHNIPDSVELLFKKGLFWVNLFSIGVILKIISIDKGTKW